MDGQTPLLTVRRSWWNYFWHWFFFFLLVPPMIAWWKRSALRLLIYEDRVVVERGVLGRRIKEVFIRDVRTLDLKQSMWQRIVGIGDIMLATSGTSGYEEEITGVPRPLAIRDLVVQQRRKYENGEGEAATVPTT